MEILQLVGQRLQMGEAEVQLRVQLDRDGALVIELEDDGLGIPAERVNDILARGGRADPDVPGQGIDWPSSFSWFTRLTIANQFSGPQSCGTLVRAAHSHLEASVERNAG